MVLYYSRSQAAHPDFPVLLRCLPASPVAGSWASLSRGWKGLGLWVRGKFLKTLGPGPQQRASRASAPCPRYHYTYPVRCQCSDAHRVRRFTDPSNLVSLATAWLQVWVFLGKSPLRTGRLQVWVFLGKSPLETGRLQVWAADKICWQDLSHHGPNATTIEGVGLGGEAALLVIIQSRVVAGIGPLVFGLILKAATSAQTFVAHPDHHTPITTPPPRHPHHHPHRHAPTPHPHNTHCAQNWVRLGCIQTETAFKANPQPWPFKIHLCNIYAGFVLYLGRACLFVALICSTEQQSQPDVHVSVCHMTAASCKP